MTSKEIKRKLIEKLRNISDDDNFIMGVISNSKRDDDRLSILEYIDKGKDVNREQLLLLSVWLDEQHQAP